MGSIADWVQRAGEILANRKNYSDRHFEDDGVTPGVDRACWLPTEEEIREECERIQAGWSEEEEERRRAKRVPWAVPTCRYRREMVE